MFRTRGDGTVLLSRATKVYSYSYSASVLSNLNPLDAHDMIMNDLIVKPYGTRAAKRHY